MATLTSDEENGRMILDIYNHFRVKPQEVLLSNNFVAWAARNRVQMNDLKAGLDYALKEGWIAERPNGFLALTKDGFDLM